MNCISCNTKNIACDLNHTYQDTILWNPTCNKLTPKNRLSKKHQPIQQSTKGSKTNNYFTLKKCLIFWQPQGNNSPCIVDGPSTWWMLFIFSGLGRIDLEVNECSSRRP